MNAETRIEELKNQHKALETSLDERTRQLEANETEVHNLKKKKLRIKDEIARLS
jgi:hypothetical protein